MAGCWLLARSEVSADRARTSVDVTLARLAVEVDPEHVQVVTDPEELAEATFVVEAVVEEYAVKERVHTELLGVLGTDAVLASTTSSLSIEQLAQASGVPERFVGLHVFNPVARMKLVELAFPAAATEETRERALALCETRSRRPPWSSPTKACPGSWSTACCSPTLLQRGAPAGRDGDGGRRHRHVHEAGGGPPDGTACTAGPGRPRRV